MGVQETQEVEEINLKKVQSRSYIFSSLKKNKKEESNVSVQTKFNSTSLEAKNKQKQNEKPELSTNEIVIEVDNSFEIVKTRVYQLEETDLKKVNLQLQTQFTKVQKIKKAKTDVKEKESLINKKRKVQKELKVSQATSNPCAKDRGKNSKTTKDKSFGQKEECRSR